MPGTGKTATTLDVVKRRLAKIAKMHPAQRKKEEFDFIHINAMALTNPNLIYTILAEKILGHKLPPQTAALFLDDFFKSSKKKEIFLRYQKGKSKRTIDA